MSERAIVPAKIDGSRWWAAVPPVAVGIAALLPLIVNARFYFYADTEDGAYGIWYDIGRSVLSGQWPLFSVDGWMAGNHAAEGQWGLWNPLILAIGVFVYAVPNALVSSSIVKISFLVLAAGGAYLMARAYGANKPLAAAAATAAPLAGFTLFMDAPSWVTNLFVWAFFPWVAWGLRRMIWSGGSPLVPLVFGYLLVTVGYVHGTILLVVLYLALLAEVVVRKGWRASGPLVLVGVVHGLVALAVYLPGVLTASVSARETNLLNDGFMVASLTGLATSGLASGRVDLPGWWGQFTEVPLLYISWFLPLFAFVDFRRLRRLPGSRLSLYIVLAFSLLFVLGPSKMGPLQFPARVMPWLALSVLVLLSVLLSGAAARPLTRPRLATALGAIAVSVWLAYSQVPTWWRFHLLIGVATAVGIVAVWWALKGRVRRLSAVAAAAAVLIVGTVGLAGLQARAFAPALLSAVTSPIEESDYADALDEAKGEAFVVGDISGLGVDASDESLISNAWYLNDTPTHNLYTPVQFRDYARDLCMSHTGITCPEAARKLFATDPTTGERLVDLLSIDTVQLVRLPGQNIAELVDRRVPEGWSLAETGEDTVTWVRNDAPEPAGEVVWESSGTAVTMEANTDMTATFRVNSVGPDGGSVVLSRLAWPGYSVSGASLGSSLRGYLLSVDIAPGSEGRTVTVRFAPAGWTVELAAMALAALITIGLAVAPVIARRRARVSARLVTEPIGGVA